MNIIVRIDPRLAFGYLFTLLFIILIDNNHLFLGTISLLILFWLINIIGLKSSLKIFQLLILPMILIVIFQIIFLQSTKEWIFLVIIKFLSISLVFNWYLNVVSPDDLTKTLYSFKIPYRYSWQISTAYRYLPYFIKETKRIYEAQISRGIPLDQGLLTRVKSLPTIIIPLLSSTQNHANQFSELLYTRNWNPYAKYNPIHPLKWKFLDYILLLILVIILVTFLYLNQYL